MASLRRLRPSATQLADFRGHSAEMLNAYPLPAGAVGALLLLSPLAPAQAQGPTLTAISPAANARAVPRNASVVATFSQPLTAASAEALKVYSSQRGGLRGGGNATVAGNALTFAPTAYNFRPGETVQLTVTRAATGSSGALVTPRVQQFTTAVGGTGRGSFGSGFVYGFGMLNGGLATGDFTGDNTLDLVVTDPQRNSVMIQAGAGRAGFVASSRVAVGANPVAVALADVDGDLDLLVANGGSASVSVRVNAGNNGFGGTQEVPTSAQPVALAVGDIDADGDLDLLVASSADNVVNRLLNNGSGTFGNGLSLNTGLAPAALSLADVDADGDLDLLVAHAGSATVGVQLNDGAGSFTTGPILSTGGAPNAVAVADVDGDGDLDLAVTCAADATVRLALNSGTGTFTTASILTTGIEPSGLALGDFDGDGDADLLVASLQDSWVDLWSNNGTGAFGPASRTLIFTGPRGLAVGDLDNDGDLDWVTNLPPSQSYQEKFNGGTGPLATAAGAAPAALTAYPNPATGRVQLTLSPTATHAELLDALGRAVRVVPAQAGAAMLDVTGLPAGLYVVHAAGQVARLVVE